MDISILYDEEFNQYLDLAKILIADLKRRNDREICVKWIRKLIMLRTNDVCVKKNRNGFFRYMLQVLQKAVEEYYTCFAACDNFFTKNNLNTDFMYRWTPDKKTYIAAKPLPGKGALIYMAVAKDISLGWNDPKRGTKKKNSFV